MLKFIIDTQLPPIQFGNIKNEELLTFFDKEISNIKALFNNGEELVLFDRLQLIVY
jgi:hypothetical protein